MKHWLYGIHTVRHALQNSQRRLHQLCLVPDLAHKWAQDLKAWTISPKIIKTCSKEQIATNLPSGAVHQGVALLTEPLPTLNLEDISWPETAIVVILDEVTDPHNIGAVLRSAAAFGVSAVITPTHHAPTQAFGTVFKTACGGGEYVPWITVTNLARTLEDLKTQGFWCYGFAETAQESLYAHQFSGRVALVLGAEGEGLRALTIKKCDVMLSLPTHSQFSTLNISNASAIALYDVSAKLHLLSQGAL
jgi:23S rRNA (guanosine2251-2'-O)-methyltransferase